MIHKTKYGVETFYTRELASDIAKDIVFIFNTRNCELSINNVNVTTENGDVTLIYTGTFSCYKSYGLMDIIGVDKKIYSLYRDLQFQEFKGKYIYQWVPNSIRVWVNNNNDNDKSIRELSITVKLRKISSTYITYFDIMTTDILIKIGDIIWRNTDSETPEGNYQKPSIMCCKMVDYLMGINGFDKGLTVDGQTRKIIKDNI